MEPLEFKGQYYSRGPEGQYFQTTVDRPGSWLADLGLASRPPSSSHKRQMQYGDLDPYVQMKLGQPASPITKAMQTHK